MGKLNLSRRTFAKLSAATAATAVIGCAVPGAALAEDAEAPSRGSEIKRVRTCCRGCGKMECGVWVTVENGRAVKVEGDQSSFQSSGNCCGKSQSSLQAAYHSDRIYHPMKRTNPKGEEPGWQRITWDEAMETIGSKFQEIMDQYGGQSIFNMCGTSRQWVYGPYAFYKWLFDTPNAHVASEICKAASPHGLDQLGRRRPVDGAARRAARVRAVGHRAGELELRRQLPQPGGPHERRRDAHLHRPAPVRLGQGGRLLAEPGAGHRRRAGAGLAAHSH